MVLTRCDNCGKKFSKRRRTYFMSKYHFHNKDCYFEFKRNNPELFKHKTPDYTYQRKLEKFARKIKNIKEQELMV